MLNSLEIENFRCFEHLAVRGLKRVNLFGGRTNVGKTTLLESIFLLTGAHNLDLFTQVLVQRGLTQFKPTPQDVWGWNFYKRKLDRDIVLRANAGNGNNRELTIALKESVSSYLGLEEIGSTGDSTSAARSREQLWYEFIDESGQKSEGRAWIQDDKVTGSSEIRANTPSSIYLFTRADFPAENAARFSALEIAGKTKALLESLRILEPRLTRLSLAVHGGVPLVHGEIDNSPPMLPVALMGAGFGRLLSIILAILSAPNGVVMIDEFENGMYHHALERIWKIIADTAQQSNVQIFATTHSLECIRAANAAFHSSYSDDYVHYRIENADGNGKAIAYPSDVLEAALEMNMEVR